MTMQTTALPPGGSTFAPNRRDGVPRDSRIQVIDERGNFTSNLDAQVERWGLRDVGFGYNIVAAFGSQRSGKSTLLNRLFGTTFDVMDKTKRQQTTKGIWMCRSRDANILVMDVEGTDGRERGEQDFKHKWTLFSLSLSEIIIVNFWEYQVGLYNGGIISLLKTIFEVNVCLVGKPKIDSTRGRTLLLFVIRDYIGTTPLRNLQDILTADIERIWGSLGKPFKLEDCQLTDFFDLAFTALPHKILVPDKFESEVMKLRRKFVNKAEEGYLIKPIYHKHVPADGVAIRMKAIWEQVQDTGIHDPSPFVPSDPSPCLPSPTEAVALQPLIVTLRALKTVGLQMDNWVTIYGLCELLFFRDTTIASEVETASDAELLVDFLLLVLRSGVLATGIWTRPRITQEANGKARRVMFKLISKIHTVPRSMLLTDIDKDPSAIAMGGFGNVFKGEYNGQLVALKILYKGHRDDSIEKDFLREALSWRSLSHRFILPLLGVYEESSRLFLVSPFMTNGTIRQWRKMHQRVRIDEIHRLLLEVAEGFEYIHGEGIVHGDLHGGNVLLDVENRCQITDFGSARHFEATIAQSTTAFALNFAAPELFGACAECGEPQCDKCSQTEAHKCKTMKTDVYAFGCLYYEIYFDTIPFQEKQGFFAFIRAVLSGERPHRPDNPRMGDFTWNLIQSCWERKSSSRPPMERIVAMLMFLRPDSI